MAASQPSPACVAAELLCRRSTGLEVRQPCVRTVPPVVLGLSHDWRIRICLVAVGAGAFGGHPCPCRGHGTAVQRDRGTRLSSPELSHLFRYDSLNPTPH